MSLPSPDTSCTAFLSDLAISLRDIDERHTYVSRHPEFPQWFRDVVRRTAGDDADREERIAVFKVVANFVADDDENRAIICEQTSLLELIDRILESASTEKVDYDTVKPFLATILNLVLSPTYAPPRTHLLQTGSWTSLLSLANRIYLPCERIRDDTADVGSRAMLASWAWKSALAVLETSPKDPETTTAVDPVSAETATSLLAPLQHLSRPPTDATSSSPHDLDILRVCAAVLGILCTFPHGTTFVHLLQRETDAGRWLLGFVEDGDVPRGWAEMDDLDSDSEEDGVVDPGPRDAGLRVGEKALGEVKARIMACLAELCASVELELFADVGGRGGWVWDTLVRWVGCEREDLCSCGLLCIGNYIHDDARARQIASQPELINHLIHLLDSADPNSPAQQTHALLGLLRNLVLAPGTDIKRTLAPHIISALERMDVFAEPRDLVASVQGGAVGLLRLLSRNDEHIARTVADEHDLLRQIMDLWTRTDEQSLKIEISRLVSALVRALSIPKGEPVVRDDRELAALTMLIGLGAAHEILLAEGVLALALVAKSAQGARAILGVLARKEDTALPALKIYASTPTAPPSILSNICILFLNLANGRRTVQGETDDTGAEQRVASQVGDVLEAVSDRGDVDDALRLVVKSAREAWK